MSQYEIKDQSSNHHYRTELPNIIFDIGLSPQLLGIYSFIKRCAGDHGKCMRSHGTISKQLNISRKTLIKFLNELSEVNPVLNKPLISIEKRISQHGDKDTSVITINDIWPENYRKFTPQEGGCVKFTQPSVKITQGVVENLHNGCVKFTHKEEHIKKNTLKKEKLTKSFSLASAMLTEFFDSLFLAIPDFDKTKAKKTQSQLNAMDALIQKHGQEVVREIFLFAHKSDFWRAHVHTAIYLSRKFETLKAQKNSRTVNASANPTVDRRTKNSDGSPVSFPVDGRF